MPFLFRCGRFSHRRMNGRSFRSLKRFDGAIELVAFRDEKGDDMVSGHRSDGNKTLAEIVGVVGNVCARSIDDCQAAHIYVPERQNALRMDPEGPAIAVADLGQAKAAYDHAPKSTGV
jgi:hypothetical protein